MVLPFDFSFYKKYFGIRNFSLTNLLRVCKIQYIVLVLTNINLLIYCNYSNHGKMYSRFMAGILNAFLKQYHLLVLFNLISLKPKNILENGILF